MISQGVVMMKGPPLAPLTIAVLPSVPSTIVGVIADLRRWRRVVERNRRLQLAELSARTSALLARVVVTVAAISGRRTARGSSRLSGVNELRDDHSHDDFAAPAAALRPPAAGPRLQLRGRDR